MKKNRGRDLVLNTIIIGIGKFSTQIVSFLLLPLYTTILTTEQYGIYDLIITISTFLLPIITLLMEESMFRFLIDCKNENEKKKVISQTVLYTVTSSLMFVILITIINVFINIPYFLIVIIYILTAIINALKNSLIRGLGKIKLYTIINFITSTMNILFNILFIAVLRYGVYGLLLSSIFSNIISFLLIFFKVKMYKYFSLKDLDKDMMKKMINYSIPLVPTSLSWTIVNLSDRLVISGLISTSANGIYSMAYKFPNLINTIYGFFYAAWKESSARAVNDDDKEQFFNDIFIILKNIMLSLTIGIIVCMPLFFNVFIKEAYKEAFLYIPILVIAMYYNNMSEYYGGIFSGYKDTKVMGRTTIIGAIINLMVDLALIKFIGIYAAAISTLVSCIVIFYYRRYKMKRYIKFDKDNNIIGYIIACITLLLYYTNSNIIIKVLNFIVVVIYALYSNKKLLSKLLNPILKV